MEMTETLLLGRKNPEIGPQLSVERTSETLPTPDDLWQGLPDNIKEAMLRETEEAGTWPSPSETLRSPSTNGRGEGFDADLLSSPTP